MKIVINLDLSPSQQNTLKKISSLVTRKRVFSTAFAVGLVTSAVAYTANVTKLYTFTAGKSISAAEVNANFDQLFTEINKYGNVLNPVNNYLGIGTSNPSTTLDVNGNTNITGNLTVTSGTLNQTGYALLVPTVNSYSTGNTVMAFQNATAPSAGNQVGMSGITLANSNKDITFTYGGVYSLDVKVNSDNSNTGAFAICLYIGTASNTAAPGSGTSQYCSEMNPGTWNGATEFRANFVVRVNAGQVVYLNAVNSTSGAFAIAQDAMGTWSRLAIQKIGG